MSDDSQKQRPNANYRLSRENIDPEKIIYHYDRERRLAKAPQVVRDLYKEQPPKRYGFFKLLGNTKPNLMLFGTIVVLCLLIWILTALGVVDNSVVMEGNELSVQGINYEGTAIISLKKTQKKKSLTRRSEAYTGAVNIAILPVIKPDTEQAQLTVNTFYNKIFFTHEPVEQYRFVVPFDQDELAIIIQTEKNTISMTVRPE
jgi:hypothetical protein